MKLLLDGIRNLPPWPPVATKVLALAHRDEVVPDELVGVIQTDPALTARVLKLCNSAYYGFQRRVASLQDAGNMLGTQALINLVLTTCVAQEFKAGQPRTGKRARRLWERSVMNALSAELLAGIQGDVEGHRAYTAGLLQNIGHVVIDDFLERHQDEIAAARAAGLDMLAAEKKVLGLNHAQIGARLARRWELPEVIVDAIEHHHTPERAAIDPMLVAVTHLAESVTYALALGEGLEGLAYSLSSSAMGLTGIGTTRFAQIERTLLLELQKAQQLIEVW